MWHALCVLAKIFISIFIPWKSIFETCISSRYETRYNPNKTRSKPSEVRYAGKDVIIMDMILYLWGENILYIKIA